MRGVEAALSLGFSSMLLAGERWFVTKLWLTILTFRRQYDRSETVIVPPSDRRRVVAFGQGKS
jgi:hypothetical protein